MKQKCLICGKGKPRRVCLLHDKVLICSKCCADIRGDECGECNYYKESENYQKSKKNKIKKFITEIKPDIEEKLDEIFDEFEMIQEYTETMREATEKLLQENPNYHGCLYAKGFILSIDGQYKEAIKYFDRVIDVYPIHIEALFNKGMCHKELLEIVPMLKAFQEVVLISDDNEIVSKANVILNGIIEHYGISVDKYIEREELFNKAFQKLQNNDFYAAIDMFEKIISNDPTSVSTYGNLGLCYSGLGNKEKAISYYNKAIELDPTYQPAIDNKKIIESMSEIDLIENFKNKEKRKTVKYYIDKILEKKKE
jgi:tetratricopeptide (TPR) repeat protein